MRFMWSGVLAAGLLAALVGCPGQSGGAAPAAGPAKPAGKLGTAKITGVVKYAGPAVTPAVLPTDGVPECHTNHKGDILSESIMVDGDRLQFAIVSVKAGPQGTTECAWEVPAAPLVLDQHGCMYAPHVSAAQANQPIKIKNSDNVYHNVHGMPKRPGNEEFNISMPNAGDESTQTFPKGEIVKIVCNAHAWMSSYVGVFEHPFFAVSQKDGAFTIDRLPAGKYTLEAWHEKLGVQEQEVTVADGESKTVEFTFKGS